MARHCWRHKTVDEEDVVHPLCSGTHCRRCVGLVAGSGGAVEGAANRCSNWQWVLYTSGAGSG